MTGKVVGVVYTAGEAVSYGWMAETVEAYLGREFVRETCSLAALKEDLEKDPKHKLKKYRIVSAEGRRDIQCPKRHRIASCRGLEPRKSTRYEYML